MLRKQIVVVLVVLAMSALSLASFPRPQEQKGANSGTPVEKTLAPPSLFVTAWAVVNADGTLARQSGDVVSTQSISGFPGAYEVIFDDNVRDCNYTATIGISGSSGQSDPGEIDVAGRVSDINGVFIQTHNSSGVGADRGFHLLVSC